MLNVTYKIVSGNLVEVNNGIYTYVIDKENLQMSIENVKAEREFYATEKGFLRELEIRQNALEFLTGNTL